KFRGYPCIRGLEQLQDLRTRFKRLWIVQVPVGGGDNQNPAVVSYLQKNARVMFLSYKAEVDLLEAIPDASEPRYQRSAISAPSWSSPDGTRPLGDGG
ncbi:MAG TPA: hypothetical protein VHS80_07340, partial [Chthoniobacterales bacterium]|nr:hypothetical protein [Chthoniobacterales bacterium]